MAKWTPEMRAKFTATMQAKKAAAAKGGAAAPAAKTATTKAGPKTAAKGTSPSQGITRSALADLVAKQLKAGDYDSARNTISVMQQL